MKHKQAFSLVELSIVLVILGLLTGGILAGKSLIRASELRAVGTEYDRWRTATYSFRDKYFALPGDMTNATYIWGDQATGTGACASAATADGTPGTCNGNGDGTINLALAGSATGEIFRYWQQLALAGLIEGTYSGVSGSGGQAHAIISTNVPSSKLSSAGWSVYPYPNPVAIDDSGGTGLFEGSYGNIYFFGAAMTANPTQTPVLRPEEAWNIDTKIDDGKPGTGRMRTLEVSTQCHNGGYSTVTAVAATAEYKLTTTTTICPILFNL